MSFASARLERPATVADAVRILGEHGANAMIIAGGTDVVPNLQMKLFAPKVLVDVKGLRELRGIEYSAEGGLRIGALTSLTAIQNSPVVREKFSVLWQAVGTIAGPLQRNMGTLGGNLCLETRCVWYNQSYFWRKALGGCLKHPMPNKDAAHPETICHVAPGGNLCWAAWSGDSAPALLVLDAEIEIAGPRGARRLLLRDFYKNNGMDRIALERDELLTWVHVPARMAGRWGSYQKLRVRNSIDYPLAGVAVTMDRDEHGVCRDARIALNAVNPAPKLLAEADALLAGQKFSAELAERLAQRAIQVAKPLTTSHSTPVYRREMVKLFTRRGLEAAWSAKAAG